MLRVGGVTVGTTLYPCLWYLSVLGLKFPFWPTFGWLLKAHVEALTCFSILLSGFIVKMGFFGVWLVISTGLLKDYMFMIQALALVGVIDSSIRLISQTDLKRVVVLNTVIEVNWVLFMVSLGNATLTHLGFLVLVLHSAMTALEFLFVEFIYNRFGTRNILKLSGVGSSNTPLLTLSFVVVLLVLGFPGTPLF